MYRNEETKRAFIVDKLLIQISNASTLEERRRVLEYLVDRLDSMFVHALEIAYDMTPMPENNTLNWTFHKEEGQNATFKVIAFHVAIEDRSPEYGGCQLEERIFISEEEMLQYAVSLKNKIIDGKICNRIDLKTPYKSGIWESDAIKEARNCG